jgi:hypothetical protein
MLAHQLSAFTEGLFGPMHSEFERTPKAASVAGSPPARASRRYTVKVHWPYVLAEAFFVAYQFACTALFLAHGLVLAAIGTAYIGACVTSLAYFYGDHAGRVCFVINRDRSRSAAPSRAPFSRSPWRRGTAEGSSRARA